MRKRRYEMLLPLKHNDGRTVSEEKLLLTREDLVARFGGISLRPNVIVGIWVHEGVRYEDELLQFSADVEDTPENQEFFAHFKATLLERFEQVEIYITSYPIDIL